MAEAVLTPPAGRLEETEITEGSLVAHRISGDEERFLIARVSSVSPGDSVYGYGLLYIHSSHWTNEKERNRLAFVSNEEAIGEEEGKPSLRDRIENLRLNIDGTAEKLNARQKGNDYSDARLLMRFYRLLSCDCPPSSHWFWAIVGESADNPRQLSWAPSMALADNNKRRRRGSVCKFLLGAGRDHGAAFTQQEAERIGFLCGYHLPESYRYDVLVKSGQEGLDMTYMDPHDDFGSCMSGKRYTRFYALTPDKVSFVRIEHNGRYVGRSLLWTVDSGEKVLDRIYSRSLPDETALKDYARSQGWLIHDGSGEVFHVTMRASNEYPYLDTFRYTDDDPEDSYRITLNDHSGTFTFEHTDGTYEGEGDRISCEQCGDRVHEDDASYVSDIGYFCSHCYDRSFVYLSYKHGSKWIEEDCNKEEARKCEKCEEWRLPEHVTKLECGDYLCEGCYDSVGRTCDECNGDYYWSDLENIDGSHYCEDCWDECQKCHEKRVGTCDCEPTNRLEKQEPCRLTLPLPLEYA